MGKPQLSIKYVDIEALIPYARNSRVHSDAQVAQIAGSIKEFGFTNPVLVDDEGGIIAGHGRVMAARILQMDKVPTITLSHLTETQKRAYVIADNKLALNAGWDDELLKLELQALADDGFEISLTGFSEDELADMDVGAIALDPQSDENEVPEPPADPISKKGDVWLLGVHRLMCGDSTSIDDMEKLTKGKKVDMWLTDPPYNVSYEGSTGLTIKNDAMGHKNFRQFLLDAYVIADSVMRPGAVFYIWHADLEGFNFRAAAEDCGWKVRQCLIWNKQQLVMGQQDYQSKHEPCLYGWKGGAAHTWASDRKQTTILDFQRTYRNAEHPTMKPVELFEYLMLNNTKRGDTVLDSFGGSGTTAIAAEKNGRTALLMELDPKYCDVIVRRWQDYTGKKAALEGSGLLFDEAVAA